MVLRLTHPWLVIVVGLAKPRIGLGIRRHNVIMTNAKCVELHTIQTAAVKVFWDLMLLMCAVSWVVLLFLTVLRVRVLLLCTAEEITTRLLTVLGDV